MGRFDVDNYAFDFRVTRNADKIEIWTEESEFQGFLKVLLHHGAKVEVFSRHEWNEDGSQRSDEENGSGDGSE